MRAFMVLVLVMGILRFLLAFGGYPNNVVKYFSMTAIIAAAAIYFAVTTSSDEERLKASFLLIMPYMIIEVGALGYMWASGRELIFHAPEYSFGGTPLALHFFGHLVGGFTWEPLIVFLMMELVWAIYFVGSSLFSRTKAKPALNRP